MKKAWLICLYNYIYISYLIVLHLCLVYFNLFSSGNVFHALHRKVNVDIFRIMVVSSYSQSSLCSGSPNDQVDEVSPNSRCPFLKINNLWFIMVHQFRPSHPPREWNLGNSFFSKKDVVFFSGSCPQSFQPVSPVNPKPRYSVPGEKWKKAISECLKRWWSS